MRHSRALFGIRRASREFSRLLADQAVEPAAPSETGSAEPGHIAGPQVYQLDHDDPWSVRDDGLADRLGLRSNHAAQDQVKRDLKKLGAALLSRLDFDSEADCFFAYATNEQDALALQDFLRAMR